MNTVIVNQDRNLREEETFKSYRKKSYDKDKIRI